MNVFGIFHCVPVQGHKTTEGLGHTGNDVTYTRSHSGSLILFECMTNIYQLLNEAE